MANLRQDVIADRLANQLYLFNPIDLSPSVPVDVAPVAVRPVVPPAPKIPQPTPTSWRGDLKLLDMVVILPFTYHGKEHGSFLKTSAVIVGFNESTQMVGTDVGTPGNLYWASPWRLVKMDD